MKTGYSHCFRALVLGLALLASATAPLSAEIVRIVANCVGGGGVGLVRYASNTPLTLEWTYDTANLPPVSSSPTEISYLGTGWLTLTVKLNNAVVATIDASSEGYISATSNPDDGDSFYMRKGLPFTMTGSYAELHIMWLDYRSMFPLGSFQIPPQPWTASAGDITSFTFSTDTAGFTGTVLSIAAVRPPSSPVDLLEALSATLGGMNLDKGTANSLDAKLASALAAQLDPKRKDNKTTINVLNAFINSVEALRGKKLTAAQADELVRLARALIAMLSA